MNIRFFAKGTGADRNSSMDFQKPYNAISSPVSYVASNSCSTAIQFSGIMPMQQQSSCIYLLYTKKFLKVSQRSESTYLDAEC